jgi:pimeloyl-ACP methyl ester carboxylesterase
MSADALLKAFFTPGRAALQDDEARLLSTASRSTLAIEGEVVPAWSWGSGPRVLLVHGWGGRGVHLGRLVPTLLEQGLSVTLYDAPGHGDATGLMTSLVHMGRAMLSVASNMGPIAAAVTHSAGSAAALWAFKHGLNVRCSVHLAGPSTLENLMRAAARWAHLNPEQYQAFRAAAAAFIGCPIEDMSVDALAAALSHPALLIHDIEDSTVPFSESQALHDRCPTSTLERVRGAGHHRMLADPAIREMSVQFVLQSLQVLDEVRPAGADLVSSTRDRRGVP